MYISQTWKIIFVDVESVHVLEAREAAETVGLESLRPRNDAAERRAASVGALRRATAVPGALDEDRLAAHRTPGEPLKTKSTSDRDLESIHYSIIVYMHMCICICVYMYICVYIYVYVYIYVCIYHYISV